MYGDLQQAKECHDGDSSLIIRLNKFKTEHLDVATNFINLGYVAFSHNNLGTVHSSLRDLQQAK